jgi:N6-L-threonylcarbamoyladenine synthase
VRTLGIETSCDETAVAVVDAVGRVEVNLLSSQIDTHARYGGVVPELASREHLEALPLLTADAVRAAGGPPELVAVTAGPGLVGALLVGVRFAAAFAWRRDLPLVTVDHLEGHQVSPFLSLEGDPPHPTPRSVLALVVSGGHSAWYLGGRGKAPERLCRTRDDAAGECFDKVAKMLGLGYPGGPVIDRLAASGSPDPGLFTQPRIKDDSGDLSFSGLKSAAMREIGRRELAGVGEEAAGRELNDLLASFETAVVAQLVGPLPALVARHAPDCITVSGGVAANSRLRRRLQEDGRQLGVAVLMPPLGLTTDNAAMIARAGQLAWEDGRRCDVLRVDAWTREVWHPPGMRRSMASAGA